MTEVVNMKASIGSSLLCRILYGIAAALTPQRWLLINALKGIGHSSIYALAKKLGRHCKNVHADVTALVQLGIIEKDVVGKIFVP